MDTSDQYDMYKSKYDRQVAINKQYVNQNNTSFHFKILQPHKGWHL